LTEFSYLAGRRPSNVKISLIPSRDSKELLIDYSAYNLKSDRAIVTTVNYTQTVLKVIISIVLKYIANVDFSLTTRSG
jgi:hypothetical protein